MRRGGKVLRALFGVVIFWGVVCLLYVGILANHPKTKISRNTVPSTTTFKHWSLSGEKSEPLHQDMNLNYVIKRRVPNGPDPIHNRRVSQSRQPPGRS